MLRNVHEKSGDPLLLHRRCGAEKRDVGLLSRPGVDYEQESLAQPCRQLAGMSMRFGLIDLLFATACIAVGYGAGFSLSPPLPKYLRVVAAILGGLGVYIAFIYPFYRGLKLFPLLLPRCPCCSKFQDGFEILCGRLASRPLSLSHLPRRVCHLAQWQARQWRDVGDARAGPEVALCVWQIQETEESRTGYQRASKTR